MEPGGGIHATLPSVQYVYKRDCQGLTWLMAILVAGLPDLTSLALALDMYSSMRSSRFRMTCWPFQYLIIPRTWRVLTMSLGLMPISSLKNLMESSLSGQLVQMYSRMTSFQYALK